MTGDMEYDPNWRQIKNLTSWAVLWYTCYEQEREIERLKKIIQNVEDYRYKNRHDSNPFFRHEDKLRRLLEGKS
jgi:hypothetical protein